MINPDLERRYADCSELVDAWKAYLDHYTKYVRNPEAVITPELEQKFMDVKARIAMLHDSFMEALRQDQNIGQNMLSIVNRSITLRHLRKLGQADQKKVEIEWHECYLLLNMTVSTIAEERERLAEINEVTWKIQKVRERIWLNIVAFFKSIYFKIIVAFAILIGIFVVPTWFGWDWDRLRENEKLAAPYGAFLDFKRDVLKMNGAYSNLGTYTSKYMDKLPNGYSANAQDSTTKEMTSGTFGSLNIEGVNGITFLNGATEFKAYQIILPDNKPPIMAYIFYFFGKEEAPKFVREFDAQIKDQNNPVAQGLGAYYTAFYDQNVLVIVGGNPYLDLRQQVKRDVFKKNF